MCLSLIGESVGRLMQTSKTGNDEGLSSLGLPGALEILKCSTRPAT